MSEPCEHEREGALSDIEIGYVCQHGHYCFYADPDEAGQCGGKRTGTIFARPDMTDGERGFGSFSDDIRGANDSLERVFEEWRG